MKNREIITKTIRTPNGMLYVELLYNHETNRVEHVTRSTIAPEYASEEMQDFIGLYC